MLQHIKENFPRYTGEGWKLSKFHDLLHLSLNMRLFGSPLNWDASGGERGLKSWGKAMAKTAQNREGKFYRQIIARVHERSTMRAAARAMDYIPIQDRHSHASTKRVLECDKIVFDGKTLRPATVRQSRRGVMAQKAHKRGLGKAKWKITMGEGKENCVVTWLGARSKAFPMNHLAHDVIVGMDWEDGAEVYVYTDYTRNSTSFRAHPSFDGKEWYDWAMVQFADEEIPDQYDKTDSLFPLDFSPSKILAFFTSGGRQGDVSTVICPCELSDHKEDSTLCESWRMELEHKRDRITNELFSTPRAMVCPVDCLDEPVFVVEENPISGKVSAGINAPRSAAPGGWCVLVSDREEWWPHQFLDLST
jgi:hypothetical protein